MSDSDKPKDSRAFGAGAFPPAPDEAELDTALAAAADLAAGLAKEVREADPPAARTSAKDERLALDQELAELERLTHKTADDLGAEPAPAPPKKKKKRAPAAVPDFMSEFTGEKPQAAPPQTGDHACKAAPDAADTVIGEILAELPPDEGIEKQPPINPASLAPPVTVNPKHMGKTGGEDAGPEARPSARAPAVGSSAALAEAKDLEASPPAPVGRPAGVVGNIENPLSKAEPRRRAPQPEEGQVSPGPPGGLGQKFYPAAERVVAVLEVLDKPFAWVGKPIKQVIGWFAVATLLTSATVLVLTMLT
jgi:hypothetical protein